MDPIDRISNTIQQLTRNARAAVGQGGSDSRFFQNTSKKGEVHELREVRRGGDRGVADWQGEWMD